MIVLTLSICPPALKGDLSKWLFEIDTGVYVGKINARVRDELWKRIQENIKDGRATMVYSSDSEQGFRYRVLNTEWTPVDYEGLSLMRRPLSVSDQNHQDNEVKSGFSKAARYQMAARKRSYTIDIKEPYCILDIETTGLNPLTDHILEIGIIQVNGQDPLMMHEMLISQKDYVPEEIKSLTGISDQEIAQKGISLNTAIHRTMDFLKERTIVGYNIGFDCSFLSRACEQEGIENTIVKTKDVRVLAKKKLKYLSDYKLETVAKALNIVEKQKHRALEDCKYLYRILMQLNKI